MNEGSKKVQRCVCVGVLLLTYNPDFDTPMKATAVF